MTTMTDAHVNAPSSESKRAGQPTLARCPVAEPPYCVDTPDEPFEFGPDGGSTPMAPALGTSKVEEAASPTMTITMRRMDNVPFNLPPIVRFIAPRAQQNDDD